MLIRLSLAAHDTPVSRHWLMFRQNLIYTSCCPRGRHKLLSRLDNNCLGQPNLQQWVVVRTQLIMPMACNTALLYPSTSRASIQHDTNEELVNMAKLLFGRTVHTRRRQRGGTILHYFVILVYKFSSQVYTDSPPSTCATQIPYCSSQEGFEKSNSGS